MTSDIPANVTDSAAPLHAVLVHATSLPGKLVKVDGAAARAAGALVITGQLLLDLDPYIGPVVRDLPLLAIDRVRYTGEPVAIVAAGSPDAARAVAASVTSTVTPLPASLTGAPNGQPALVHLTELLRPGPLADGIDLQRERTNRLLLNTTRYDTLTPGRNAAPRSAALRSNDSPGPETLHAEAQIAGAAVTLRSAAHAGSAVDAQLAQVFDPAGLELRREPGPSASPIAVQIDALAIAVARLARRPVHLTAETGAFGWSGTRGHLDVIDDSALLTIPAGASVGMLPVWIAEFRSMLEARYALRAVTIALDYAEAPPIAASLDDWRGSLAPE